MKNSEEKKNPRISAERMRRFTWEAGDLIVYKNMEEMIEAAKKDGRKVIIYGQNGEDDKVIE